MQKKTIVVHSGGMDSSICLALAIEQYGAQNVLAMSFTYGQRHSQELLYAQKICEEWGVERIVIDLNCLNEITENALLNKKTKIEYSQDNIPNTLVVGRNGLMARIAAIHAHHLGAKSIFMGVIEIEEANSGYRDCSRKYMDIIQAGLRMDFAEPEFEIKTPLVYMTKLQTMELAYQIGKLHFLLENTLTCYEGIPKQGCGKCPACKLRNEGIKEFCKLHPDFGFSYYSEVCSKS
ncbi:MAG: 7-cyano-7-deazaguanine synthase QueC [Halobacteriovoraceae bacterium]|jgi:7-cyano-7-deazaguanine synthase|nr:7-cyano-7-deazaguanine synthase QueC [Halobacteriovoraceae bacterium]